MGRQSVNVMVKKITAIAVQKRPGRYNIFLDGQFELAVAESVLIKYRLMKGMELTPTQIAELKVADQGAKAYQRTLDFLSHQLRTEQEVRQRLTKDEVPIDTIDAIIVRLQAERLLDDQVYADSYVRTVMRTELKGPQIITQKLRQKGVAITKINQALLQFTTEQQVANATKLATKLQRRYRKDPQRRQQQKVHQGLLTNGYDGTISNLVLEQLTWQVDSQQQTDLLTQTAQKIWQRNQKYSDAYERTLKTKQALVRKGFDFDDINAWFAENDLD